MASSAAPPVVSRQHPVKPEYDLGELPNVPGADPKRSPMDAFRLGIAQTIAKVWDQDIAKVFNGVETGMIAFEGHD